MGAFLFRFGHCLRYTKTGLFRVPASYAPTLLRNALRAPLQSLALRISLSCHSGLELPFIPDLKNLSFPHLNVLSFPHLMRESLLHCLDVFFDKVDFGFVQVVFFVELLVDFLDGGRPVDVAVWGKVLERDVCPGFTRIVLSYF